MYAQVTNVGGDTQCMAVTIVCSFNPMLAEEPNVGVGFMPILQGLRAQPIFRQRETKKGLLPKEEQALFIIVIGRQTTV